MEYVTATMWVSLIMIPILTIIATCAGLANGNNIETPLCDFLTTLAARFIQLFFLTGFIVFVHKAAQLLGS